MNKIIATCILAKQICEVCCILFDLPGKDHKTDQFRTLFGELPITLLSFHHVSCRSLRVQSYTDMEI